MELPEIYVVNRNYEDAAPILNALGIHPPCFAVVSSVLDYLPASRLVDSVGMAVTEATAMEVARNVARLYNRPVIVLGEAVLLDAIYADGRREPVNVTQNQEA